MSQQIFKNIFYMPSFIIGTLKKTGKGQKMVTEGQKMVTDRKKV